MRSPPSRAAPLCNRTSTPLRPAPPRCPPDPHLDGPRGSRLLVPAPFPHSNSHSQCCSALCSCSCVAADRQAHVRLKVKGATLPPCRPQLHPLLRRAFSCAAQPMSGLKAEGDLFEMIKLEVQRDANVRKRRASGNPLTTRPAGCS